MHSTFCLYDAPASFSDGDDTSIYYCLEAALMCYQGSETVLQVELLNITLDG